MRATWYVLEDGSMVDPSEVATDEAGVLRHKDGLAVAMRGGVPHTSGVDLDAVKKPAPKSDDGGEHHGRDMKPEAGKHPYKTRESKAK